MTNETAWHELEKQQNKRYYHTMTPVRRIATVTLRTIFRLFTTSQVQDVENLPSKGAVILAANHVTNFDVFLIQFAVNRPIFFMGKAELFQNPIQDWLFRRFGSFPVRRGEQDLWAIKHAGFLLEKGQVLGMFPEGKRNRGNGLRKAKTGTARLAMSTHCPVVPVAIYGTHKLLNSFPQRTPIQITIGQSIFPEPDDTQDTLTERLMFRIAEMLPFDARGAYR